MLLKTHGEKMSVFRPLAMLMKINLLRRASRDVDEKKVGYRAPLSWLVVGLIDVEAALRRHLVR